MENLLNLPLTRVSPVRYFLDVCAAALFAPTKFFRESFARFSTAELITLGLLSAWIAGFIGLFWASLNDLVLQSLLQNWMHGLMSTEEGYGLFAYDGNDFLTDVGLTLVLPFWALLRMVFSASLLWVFARLLISRQERNRPVDWTACLRIVAVASIGRWFGVVPVLGGFIALLAVVVLMVTGVHEYFQVSYRRASFIVLLPTLAVAAFILMSLLFFGLILLLELPSLLNIAF
jgi:hypothetical protein